MEIKIRKEDLSQHDTGGGCREVIVNIEIDKKASHRQQRRTVIYEALGAVLDPFEIDGEKMECLTDVVMDALDQLGTR